MAEDTEQLEGQAPQPDEGQEPDSTPEAQPEIDTTAQDAEIKKLRREAAKWRTQLRKLEEADAERQRAEMSEVERLKADLEAAELARTAAIEGYKQQALEAQIVAAASTAGMHDPADAVRLIGEIDIDEDGKVTGLDKALDTLKASKPYLFRGSTPALSPTNPIGGPQKKTDKEIYAEIYGNNPSSLFEGGGVVMPTQE
jgi:hypothetical protein